MLALKLHWLRLAHAADIQRRRHEMCDLRRFTLSTSMLDREFLATYRLPKAEVCNLVEELTPLLPPSFGDITPERKILTCLNFLGTGCGQRSVGQNMNHGVSQSSTSKAINEVVNALNSPAMLQKYLRFPRTPEERTKIKDRFYEIYNLPGILGAVDGTHVPILRPKDGEENFFNRKHFHSLNVQVICDADLNILSVDASNGGSTHDSATWSNHPAKTLLESLHENGEMVCLLGDSAYPQRETMMTPIVNAPEGSPEAYYTFLQVRARNCIERCFGMLKMRWRCLSSMSKLQYTPAVAAKIVNACCVLHNIANEMGAELPPLDAEEELQEQRMAAELDARQETAEIYLAMAPDRRRVNQELQLGRAARQALIRRIN